MAHQPATCSGRATLPASFLPRSSSSSLVAASVFGLGRVALPADVLVSSSAQNSLAQPATIASSASSQSLFSSVRRSPNERRRSLFDVAGAVRDKSRASPRRRTAAPSPDKLAQMRSWLDSSDTSAGEEEDDQGEVEVRVSGKSVRVLKRRKLSPERSPAPVLRTSARQRERAREVTPTIDEQRVGKAALVALESSVSPPLDGVASFGPTPARAVSLSEPVLVASSTHPPPLAQSSSFTYSLSDLALAPSPQPSPGRHYALSTAYPHSPQSSAVPTPCTPVFGATKAHEELEQRSPLYYRGGRIRMVSGAFEDPPSAVLRDWDLAEPLMEEDLLGRSASWHDLNTTPSRSLCSSALGYSFDGGLHTPLSHRRAPSKGFGTSSAQDFLRNLASEEEPAHVAHRLFAPSPVPHARQLHTAQADPWPPVRSSSPHLAPMSSPLGPKRTQPHSFGYAAHGHRRTPSQSGYNTPSHWAHGALDENSIRGVFGTPMSVHEREREMSYGYERRSESPTMTVRG